MTNKNDEGEIMQTAEQKVRAAEAALRTAQAELRLALQRREALADPDRQLADLMHSTMCKQNHTDQCGWMYEQPNGVDDWSGRSHARYLGKARRLLELVDSPVLARTITEVFVS